MTRRWKISKSTWNEAFTRYAYFLWFIGNSPELSLQARALLEDDHELWLSVGSLWEIAIKVNLGKLNMKISDGSFDTFIARQLRMNSIRILQIKLKHLARVARLPHQQHKDPFDRLIVAQAMVERYPIVGADSAFDAYQVLIGFGTHHFSETDKN